MKVEYINPFVAAAITAFDTMLECSLKRGALFVRNQEEAQHEISGVIGLTGKAKGTVVLGLNREAALSVTETLTDERPETIDATVADAVGELTNIIAGSAKVSLEELDLSVGLPSVITGKGHRVGFPSQVTPICIPFESKWGDISVEVGLTE